MTLASTRVTALKPSETLAIKAKATALKEKGVAVVDLSAGEPDIDTPEHIKEAAIKALKDGRTKYTPVQGIKELREAIAEKLTNENKVDTHPDSVIVCNGGKQALYEALMAIIEPGDEVIIPAPYWVSYPPMVEIAGGKPVVLKTSAESGYKMTASQLSAVITPKTKCVILNSPSNPTGAAYSLQELKALEEVLLKSNCFIISDEIYEKLTYGDFEFVSFAAAIPSLASRTITANGLSKTYSMTGWRVGYATGPKEIISGMIKYQSQTTSNICTPAQYASIAAIKGSHEFLTPLRKNFERRIDLASKILNDTGLLSIPRKPEGAFYLFVRFDKLASLPNSPITSSAKMIDLLLDQAGVAAVPGEAFGDDLAFRISVACADATVEEGAKKIAHVATSIIN